MDFTDKGIQVVKLTPEYFEKKGWDVHYLVTRDNSKNGSYHYQDIIDPVGIKMHRLSMPQLELGENFTNHTLKTIYSKLRGYISIIKLAWFGYKIAKNNKIDVLYGGGPHGVLAAHIINFCLSDKRKVVARFYGTFMYDKLLRDSKKEILFNWDEYLAFRLQSDKIIITNDGTQGDKALEQINSKNLNNLNFFVNGVEKHSTKSSNDILSSYTVCRMASWKRVDRVINIIAILVKTFGITDFKYNVIGDGDELIRLKKMTKELDLDKNIIFHGAIKHDELDNIISKCSICFSTYDLSNVGNPLLEAIRENKIIFTLNNGDTSSWIKHNENGFIYDVNDNLYDNVAKDVVRVLEDINLQDKIIQNIKYTEKAKLWTWDERLDAEYQEINKLVER